MAELDADVEHLAAALSEALASGAVQGSTVESLRLWLPTAGELR